MAAPRVFLSYRRGDSAGHAGRLYDRLAARFGRERVFQDLEAIPPGADFAERIATGVQRCDVLLVVIGPARASATDQAGQRRLDAPGDLVVFEVAAALHHEVPVIPVLVHQARMPSAEELPERIAALASRNAVEISDARWDYDLERLVAAIEQSVQTTTKEKPDVRRTVTVVLADLVGSTALGERLDPEALRQVVTRFYERAAAALGRHGGARQKLLGDDVMAVFGVPTLHEDDALRAVKGAVELRGEIAALNDELRRDWGTELEVRVGVNTGVVIIADSAQGQDVTVGDTVTVAARLEQHAEPGDILLGESTYRLVRDAVAVDHLDPLPVKRKTQPIQAWRLTAVRAGVPGRERRLSAPMVGRATELALLTQTFQRAVADRACYLATVLGSAGVGKSRLVHELLTVIGDQATVLRGRCLDYGDGITFWPVAEIVRQAVGATEASPPEDVRAGIAAVLQGEEQAPAIAERVAGLLGLVDDAAPVNEAFWAVRRLLESLARSRPLVVVLDDLHWAEPTLLDLVEHTTDLIRDAPLLLCCIARSELLELRPSWGGGKPNATAMRLEPLPQHEADQLVGNLLGRVEGGEHLTSLLTQRAEGNPLFLEELVAMLEEQGVLSRDDGRLKSDVDPAEIPMPPTIAALLAARLDQLEGGERSVIGRASVVGKVFYRGAVRAMSPERVRDDVDEHLTALVRKDLVRRDSPGFAGEDAYRFRHLLVRDAAYEVLSRRERAELHERLADWFLGVAGHRLAELEEIVAVHLEQAYRDREQFGLADAAGRQLARRAAGHLGSSGQRALDRDDARAAVKLLTRAAELLPDDDQERPALIAALGEALSLSAEYQQAAELLTAEIGRHQTTADHRVVMRLRLALLEVRSLIEPAGWVDEARAGAAQALKVFEPAADAPGLASAWRLLALVDRGEGRSAQAEHACQQILRYARQAGNGRLAAWSMAESAINLLWGPAPVDEGLERCSTILDELVDRPLSCAVVLDNLAGLQAMAGDANAAEQTLARSTAIRADVADEFWEAIGPAETGGYLYMVTGDPIKAQQILLRAYDALDQIGEKGVMSTQAALLAQAICLAGGPDEEAERFARISQATAATEDIHSQIPARGALAKVLARRGELREAERLASEAVRLAEATDWLSLHADALVDLATVLGQAGRFDDARPAIRAALRLYRSKGNRASAARARSTLAASAQGG
jgi:class 3 adenylate cyclase/tetratricopeptide (TPR) repeat protein